MPKEGSNRDHNLCKSFDEGSKQMPFFPLSQRQRVYLATELLSRTVANAIEVMYKDRAYSDFVRTLNDFFDVMVYS